MAHDDASSSATDSPVSKHHDVFISYSAKDHKTVDAICKALEAQDIKCFIAHRDIPGGELYPGAIIEAINASRVFVLVFSSYSNSSNDVMNEVERAFQNEIPIIPFKVENVQLSLDMQYFISARQFVDAFTPPLKYHLETLVDAVTALLKVPRKTKRARQLSPAQLKVGLVVTVALIIGALLIFNPFKARKKTVDYESQFKQAIELLSSSDLPKRLEGIRALDQLSNSGSEDWYWQAMNQLTGFVKAHAPLPADTDKPQKEIPPDLQAALQVIASRPPKYPPAFTERDKEKKRRNLQKTDLRGLRLVEKAHLEYVDLEGANLENAVLTGATLQGAMLKDSILINADLGGTCLEGTDLGGADVYGANLRATDEQCMPSQATTERYGLDVDNLILAHHWECAGLTDKVRGKIQSGYGSMPKCE